MLRPQPRPAPHPARPRGLRLGALLPSVVGALLGTLVALGAGRQALCAQEWRTLESSRQLRDSAPLAVNVRFGAGRIELRPTADRVLYAADLRFDPERASPRLRYDSIGRRLDVGLAIDRAIHVRNSRAGELRLALSHRVPIDLTLELGAVEADLALGGLALETLHLSSGASETTLRFDSATVRPVRRMHFESGAGALRVRGLAHAAPATIELDAGVGSAELDFSGPWRRDVDLEASFAMGGLTLRVPREVGVRVEMDRFLTGFDHEGMRRRGDAWVSDNWDDARHRLRLRASAAFGKLRIERE